MRSRLAGREIPAHRRSSEGESKVRVSPSSSTRTARDTGLRKTSKSRQVTVRGQGGSSTGQPRCYGVRWCRASFVRERGAATTPRISSTS
jgi:hypothetical protein